MPRQNQGKIQDDTEFMSLFPTFLLETREWALGCRYGTGLPGKVVGNWYEDTCTELDRVHASKRYELSQLQLGWRNEKDL